LTQAENGEGLESVYEAIAKHHGEAEKSSNMQRRRSERRKWEFAQIVRESVEARIAGQGVHSDEVFSLVTRVQSGDIDPYTAAAQALDRGDLGRVI
jgi:putative protein kinase ArgK-like GTPase of G3E family